ncbi:lectin-like domain-containing protein [Weissella paramesenteroides]
MYAGIVSASIIVGLLGTNSDIYADHISSDNVETAKSESQGTSDNVETAKSESQGTSDNVETTKSESQSTSDNVEAAKSESQSTSDNVETTKSESQGTSDNVETAKSESQGTSDNTQVSQEKIAVNYKDISGAILAQRALSDDAFTEVDKSNFLDYFERNGSATYNQDTGIVTITPDEYDKVGNFSLKSKIDMNTSFTLTGQINLGTRTSSQGGADGIGFAFHNGNTTDIGNAGGNLGIGGLQKAIGFKLDTYHNGYRTPQVNEDGAQVASTDSNGYGWDTDPDGTKFPQFGAFVDTSQKLVQAQDGHYYSRWWAKTDMSSVQKLNSGDLDGQFHDFVVSYDSSNRKLTIKYTETDRNVLTWSTSIPDTYRTMAMVVSASTGGFKNRQQFKISSFDFKQAATVNVKYVDTKGNQIAQGEVTYPNGANVNGTYTTGQLEIPNYKFVRMDDGTATGAKSLPATGTLTKAGDNGTVIYVYAPAYTQTSKTISETIKYIDQDGKEVAIGYTADPITFVTVTNPVDNTTTTYYSTKAKTATLDDNGVPTEAGWTKADSTDFAEVVNPEVDGYEVISNDAPNSDLTSVAVQTVYTNSSDLDFTVVYAKNAPTVTTESKVVNETIHYVYDNGSQAADDYVAQPVTFTRTVSTDAVTGEKTYGEWSADQSFAAVTSPAIKGYTPDQAQIATQTVNSDSSDLEFKVIYTKNEIPVNPSEPDTPVNPSEPDAPVNPSEPDTPVNPQLPQTHAKNEQNARNIDILLVLIISLLGLLRLNKNSRKDK